MTSIYLPIFCVASLDAPSRHETRANIVLALRTMSVSPPSNQVSPSLTPPTQPNNPLPDPTGLPKPQQQPRLPNNRPGSPHPRHDSKLHHRPPTPNRPRRPQGTPLDRAGEGEFHLDFDAG